MPKSKIGGVLLKIEADVADLKKGMKQANRSLNSFERKARKTKDSLSQLFKGFLAFKGFNMFKDLIRGSLKFNGEMEDAKIALEAITAAGLSWTDTAGNMVTAQERLAIVQRDSNAVFMELKGILPETATSLKDLTTLYSLMTPAMSQAGVAMKDQVQLLKLITNTASKFGISAQQLSTGIDDLGRGTLKASSELGKLFAGLGITNEALKKSSDLTAFLTEKLAETGKAADNMATATNELGDTWDILKGKLTDDIWNPLKELIKATNTELGKNGVKAAEAMGKAFHTLAKYGVQVIGYLLKAVNGLVGAMQVAWNGFGRLGTLAAKIGTSIKSTWYEAGSAIAGAIGDKKSQEKWKNQAEYLKNFGKEAAKIRNQKLDTDIDAIANSVAGLNGSIDNVVASFVEYEEVAGGIKETDKKLKKIKNELTDATNKGTKAAKKASKAAKTAAVDIKQVSEAHRQMMLQLEEQIQQTEDYFRNLGATIENGIGDALLSLVDKATSFGAVMRNVLNDIARQIMSSGLSKLFGNGTNGIGSALGSRLSDLFGGGSSHLDMFAKGGIVDQPTFVGKHSIAGESGSEAVIPLVSRNGIVGVGSSPVTVNVQNYGGGQVEVQQQGDSYEIIVGRLAQDIKRGTGNIGSVFEQRYGMRKA